MKKLRRERSFTKSDQKVHKMEVPYKLEMTALAVLAIKIGVSLHPYSGKGKPPMFGDYEAQRHWMEVTVNLPVQDWYRNTTDNDLLYWGLDYPPLTAFHSLLIGLVARYINPAYVELEKSRGFESTEHQFFMRMSVLVFDLLVYVSALYSYIKSSKLAKKHHWVVFALCSHPALTLIDYGHFQYNTVSLGLALWAIVFLLKKSFVAAAVSFSLALNYKQMELYHAIPIFFYLLAICWSQKTFLSKLSTLFKIGVGTVATFILVWSPFILDLSDFQQVLHRVFPFDRGIFEDYVANFWCSLNVLVKIRNLFDSQTLTRICLSLTALTSLPCGIQLFFKPRFTNLLVSLVNVALAFFLFSYHVHEKSILLPALPVSLLSPYQPLACIWFLCIAHFSMFPLYIKDNIVIPSISLFFLYVIMSYNSLKLTFNRWVKLALLISGIVSLVLTVLTLFVAPPKAYPYLWTLLISLFSFIHFVGFFLYFLKLQFWDFDKVDHIRLD